MAAVLIALFLLWITPVKAGVILRGDGKSVEIRLGIMVWGLRLTGRAIIGPGMRRLSLLGRQVPFPKRREKRPPMLSWILSLRRVMRRHPWLRQGARMRKAEIQLELGLRDAAAAALLTGLIRALSGVVQGLVIRARPRLDGQWRVYAACIIEGRAGMIGLACALARLSNRKKEEKPWSIPSAA